MNIAGIIPPVVTPLKNDESLNLRRLESFIDELLARGVHGIFVLGTNSEFYAFDEGEKQAIIATAVAHVNRRCPVFAGTGAETTREVVRLTRMAEKEGADGVSVITPYFIKPNQQELYDHFRRVAEHTSLPVMLYNNPGTCGGVKIDVETTCRLAELPNVCGIKDSSGDMQNTLELIRLCPPDFAVLMGRDTLICAGLMFGAKGAVPATANIAPELAVAIYDAVQRGDFEAAKAAQRRLTPIRMALALGTSPGVVKAALNLLGKDVGPTRRPVGPLSAQAMERLGTILREAGLEVKV